MGQRFDFTPSLDVQNIEIPITNGLTSLHAEFTISAPADPLGRIVSILGLRGNLTGQGRKKRRPLHFNFTQGQDHQARFEAEITLENEDGQERGPRMVFPGTHKVVIDWDADTGVARASLPNTSVGSFSIDGPSTGPITNGFLYIGGHVSKPPAPGEPPVYTAPIGCRLTGFVAFNGEKMEEGEDNDNGSSPIEPMPVGPLPPVTPIIPPTTINPPNPPVIKPSQPITTPPITTPTPSTPPTKPTNPNNDKVLGLDRTDLILILRSILSSFERGEDIDLRSILAQVLAPILLNELLNRR